MMVELSSPLRVTWDLPANEELARLLWRKLVEGRVLFVDALVSRESIGALGAIGEEFALPGGPRVTLSIPGDLIDELSGFGAWISSLSLNILPPYGDSYAELSGRVGEVSIALWSTPEGLQDFKEAIYVAKRSNGSIAIMNPHAKAQALSAAHRASALAAWSEAGEPSRVPLRVHDLFLSEALGLEPFKAYAGCAAASSLAHLTHAGKLVACRTLPLELGDLVDTSLKDIWKLASRSQLAKNLSALPEECEPCSLSVRCGGGCPGLAPEAGLRDTSCEGVRD